MYGFSMSDINNSIREFRLKRGLSATELARQTEGEFSPSRISNYETGVRQLTIEAAKKLSPHLGASPGQLLNLTDNFFSDVQLGEHQEELVRILGQVSLRGDSDVKKVIGILRGYLDS